MTSPSDISGNDIFSQLQDRQNAQAFEARAQQAQAEEIARAQREQQHLESLVSTNSTLPTTLSSIHVLGAQNTRSGFLRRIFDPIVTDINGKPSTLQDVVQAVEKGVSKLHALDIFQHPIPVIYGASDPSNPSSSPSDLDVFLPVKERNRLLLKIGTDVGNAEGSGYINALGRNVFGGAETVNLNGSIGTRTRSAYQGTLDTPVLSNPNLRLELGALASDTQKPWASHEEVLKGGWTKLKWLTENGARHELAYNGVWRQITGLAADASRTVRGDAGDSFKSSLSHVWWKDRRDNPLLPSSGYLTKSVLELAGWGPLHGDVAFGKAEVEAQGALPMPLPGTSTKNGITLTTGFRAGLLYPLPLGLGNDAGPSRINDRFQLGGPTDVRGFRLSGLGPHDAKDAVGGDLYAAGSANLLFPIPWVGADRPFRLQTFINGGRLLALKQQGQEEEKYQGIHQRIASTVTEMANGLPSMSAGFGLVYAAPMARLELNFSLPLVLRKGEEGRKGLSFGIGINML